MKKKIYSSVVKKQIYNTTIVIKLILAFTISLTIPAHFLKAQTYDYAVNWSDTTTYKTSCGKVVAAQWSVKNDSCSMTTPHLRVENLDGCKVSFDFRINQSGNGELTDRCYVYHQIDDGAWVPDTLIPAGGNPEIHSYSNFIFLNYGHYIQFRICMETNSNTEFWAIKGGDMDVTDGDPTQQNISSWSETPPPPSAGSPIMPVELLKFSANSANSAVALNWITASETNNDYFTIEKSVDGITYQAITTVKGAGNSNTIQEYTYYDFTSFENAYYRLKQTDFNGSSRYMGIVLYEYNSAFTIIPSLTYSKITSIIQLSVYSANTQQATLVLFDENGKAVLTSGMEATKGINEFNISTAGIGSGIYICHVAIGNEWYSTQLLVN